MHTMENIDEIASKSSEIIDDGCGPESYPILYSHLNKVNHNFVPIIHYGKNNHKLDLDRVKAYRQAGTPFVIKGFKGWTGFADSWITINEKNEADGTIPINENELNHLNGKKSVEVSLNVTNFLSDIQNVKVPVISPNYDDCDPIKLHIPLERFVTEYWIPNSPLLYLHQWQFPIAGKQARKKLCYRNEPLPLLGLDLLQFWHDSLIHKPGTCDSPFQYLFMGAQGTFSRLHRDRGGLTLIISPIIGRKEVIMCHKDDANLLYQCSLSLDEPDYNVHPLAAFARTWKVLLQPGDILVMSPGTFHSARNFDACLSYSKLHLDDLDYNTFFYSWQINDSPSIRHREIIWNATIELIHILEVFSKRISAYIARFYKQQKEIHRQILQKSRKVETITDDLHAASVFEILNPIAAVERILCRDVVTHFTKLRHMLNAVVQLSMSSLAHGSFTFVDNIRDWQLLLGDVDHALCTYLAAEKQVQPILFSYAAVETISTEESNEHPVVDSNVDVIAIDLSCSVTQPIVNHVRFNGDVSDSDHIEGGVMAAADDSGMKQCLSSNKRDRNAFDEEDDNLSVEESHILLMQKEINSSLHKGKSSKAVKMIQNLNGSINHFRTRGRNSFLNMDIESNSSTDEIKFIEKSGLSKGRKRSRQPVIARGHLERMTPSECDKTPSEDHSQSPGETDHTQSLPASIKVKHNESKTVIKLSNRYEILRDMKIDRLRVFIGKHKYKATIVETKLNAEACRVHYVGFPNYYDEYMLTTQIRSLDGVPMKNHEFTKSRKLAEFKQKRAQTNTVNSFMLTTSMGTTRLGWIEISIVHSDVGTVMALWGSQRDEFIATILTSSVTGRTDELSQVYVGPLVKVRFDNLLCDWDRWYIPGMISGLTKDDNSTINTKEDLTC